MPNTAQELVLRISGDSAEAQKAVQELIEKFNGLIAPLTSASGAMGVVSTSFAELIGGVTAANLLTEGIRGMADAAKDTASEVLAFVADSVQAAASLESAHVRLAAAVTASGQAALGATETYTTLAETIAQTSTTSETAATSIIARFIQLGQVGPDQMGKATEAALNLSAGLGVDLDRAVTMISRALEGSTAGLGRYGIVLDQTRLQAEGASYIFEALNERFGGQSQAQLETYAGQVTRLSNSWEHFEATIGTAIVTDPVVIEGLKDLNAVVEDLIAGFSGGASKSAAFFQGLVAGMPGLEMTLAMLQRYHDELLGPALERQTSEQLPGMIAGAQSRVSALLGTLQVPGVPDKDAVAQLTAQSQILKNRIDLGVQLSQEQKEEIAQGVAAKATTEQLAAATGLTVLQVGQYVEALKKASEAATQHAAGVQRIVDTLDGETKAEGNTVEAIRKVIAAHGDDEVIMGRVIDAIDKLHAQQIKMPSDLEAWREAQGLNNAEMTAMIDGMHNFEQSSVDAASAIGKSLLPQMYGLQDLAQTLGTKTLPGLVLSMQQSTAAYTAANLGRELERTISLMPDLSGAAVQRMKHLGTQAGDPLITSLDQTLQKIPSVFEHAFLGGGGISGALKSIATQVGADFGKSLTASIKASLAEGGTGLTGTGLVAAGGLGALAGLGTAAAGGSFGQAAEASMMAGVSAGIAAGVAEGATLATAATIGATTAGVGLAAVGVYELVKSFGVSADEKNTDTSRNAFFASIAGVPTNQLDPTSTNIAIQKIADEYAQLGKSAQLAQADIQRLFNAKDPESYNAALKPIADSLKEIQAISTDVSGIVSAAHAMGGLPPALQSNIDKLLQMTGLTDAEKTALEGLTPTIGQLTQTAAKYGLTLDDLGGKTQQLDITQKADQIEKDFQLLVGSGADYGNTVNHFATQISGLVDEAIKYGGTLPTALQPIAQALVNAGELTDATGKKITDLSGIHFDDTGDPLAKGLKSLTDAITNLTNLLQGLPAAATTAANGIGNSFSNIKPIDIPIHWTVPDLPKVAAAAAGGFVTPHGIVQYFDQGVFLPRGTDSIPAMLTPGEAVLNVDAAARLGSSTIKALNAGASLPPWSGRDTASGPAVSIVLVPGYGLTADQIVDATVQQLPRAILGNVGGVKSDLKRALDLQTTRWATS